MANTPTDLTDAHLDLVPMIDCIMLLLLFFMMTTKFTADEKSIAAILPATQGTGTTKTLIEPPPIIAIAIYPAGLTAGYQPSEYMRDVGALHAPGQVIGNAYLRIGKHEPLLIPGSQLTALTTTEEAQMAMINRIHQAVADGLVAYEQVGAPRSAQPDILISCYSGLSWKFALSAYDAVRAYEGAKNPQHASGDPAVLASARAVNFAAPPLRDQSPHDAGDELYQIINRL